MSQPTDLLSPLRPPERLLCGPGPTNVEPSVLEAMSRPMIGHLDPTFHDLLTQVVERLRATWRTAGGLVLALSSTGTSGMEAGIVNLVAPGETVIVAVNGYFGRRIVEIARRHGADVVAVEADWGAHVPNEQLLDALERHPQTRLLAVVHAETSTGVEHPLAQLGELLDGHDVLLMADCVTSLGGVELDVDGWGIDYAYSCTQKCLGAPPGLSPVAVSDRALERIQSRTHAVPFSLDLDLLRRYWVTRPAVYHHTAPVLQIYALHEALRVVLDEGLSERWLRHDAVAAHLRRELSDRGLELLAEPEHQLAPLTAVRVPPGVDEAAIQRELLREHGIEIGGGLGPDAPSIWRIGLMGPNASENSASRVVGALDAALAGSAPLAAGTR